MNPIEQLMTNQILINHNKNYLKTINENLTIIINSFVMYYGEEYRDIITSRIKNTNIYTYISNCTIEAIYDYLITNKYFDKKYMQIFRLYDKKSAFAKLFNNKIKIDNFYKKQIVNSLSSDIQINGFHVFTFDKYNNPISNVFVALFADTKNLIHELNHSITSEVLALEMDDNNLPATIVRNGIANIHASNHYKLGNGLEEIINDIIAEEITKIFYNLGGNLPQYKIKYPETIYSELFPVIDKFYNKYKDLLKIARITGNTNILFTKIDKCKFEEFQKMIDECLEIVSCGKIVPNWVADDLLQELEKSNQKVLN